MFVRLNPSCNVRHRSHLSDWARKLLLTGASDLPIFGTAKNRYCTQPKIIDGIAGMLAAHIICSRSRCLLCLPEVLDVDRPGDVVADTTLTIHS
jgi:hypothetical protein